MRDRTDEVLLKLENVTFSYEGEKEKSLDNVSLNIKKGRKIAVMGANGSGKSTLFLCCNGIHKPSQGTVYYHGKPVEYSRKGLLSLRSGVGIVFQDPDNQLFSASVYQEISFGACNIGMSETEVKKTVEDVMERLNITPFCEKPTHALSGGQKKQVSIADILVMKPEIILLDEPNAALDPWHSRVVNGIVEELTKGGITIMMATHDMDYAYAWADEIILMNNGKIVKQGSPCEVCTDKEALAQTNLELPAVFKIYESLCRKGILRMSGAPPRCIEELQRCIERLPESSE